MYIFRHKDTTLSTNKSLIKLKRNPTNAIFSHFRAFLAILPFISAPYRAIYNKITDSIKHTKYTNKRAKQYQACLNIFHSEREYIGDLSQIQKQKKCSYKIPLTKYKFHKCPSLEITRIHMTTPSHYYSQIHHSSTDQTLYF